MELQEISLQTSNPKALKNKGQLYCPSDDTKPAERCIKWFGRGFKRTSKDLGWLKAEWFIIRETVTLGNYQRLMFKRAEKISHHQPPRLEIQAPLPCSGCIPELRCRCKVPPLPVQFWLWERHSVHICGRRICISRQFGNYDALSVSKTF